MCLALDCKALDPDIDTAQMPSRNSILEQFAPVGRALVKHCALGKYLFHVLEAARSLTPCQQSSAEL